MRLCAYFLRRALGPRTLVESVEIGLFQVA